jgi:hypothetical protein
MILRPQNALEKNYRLLEEPLRDVCMQKKMIVSLKNAVCWDVMSCDSLEPTALLIRATRRHIPEDGILHTHRRENPKSYDCSLLFRSLRFCNFSSNWGGDSFAGTPFVVT